MSSAEHLTREQLVQRVRELEAELGRVASGHAVAAPPATPADAAVHVAKDAKKRSASHTEGGKAKRARKAFDMSRYRQRHIALKVAYVGTNYHGLAVQANAPSVEAELFKALERTRLIEGRDTCNYSRCGRTDKGVSALGQVVALHLRSNLSDGVHFVDDAPPVADHAAHAAAAGAGTGPASDTCVPMAADDGGSDAEDVPPPRTHATELRGSIDDPVLDAQELQYDRMLNRVLPDDIRVLGWAPVHPDFSARFSCSARTYRYIFVRRTLDIERMQAAAARLLGEHDFRNFCKMDPVYVSNYTRRVLDCTLQRYIPGRSSEEDVWYLQVRGTAFLWHQIRCMVSVLFLVGDGREEPSVVDWLLDVTRCPRRPTYLMASEVPLLFYDVEFEGLRFRHSRESLQQTTTHFERMWASHAIAAARTRTFLDLLDTCAVAAEDGEGGREVRWREVRPPVAPDFAECTRGDHKPLRERDTGMTYEERLAALSGARLQRRQENDRKGGDEAEDRAVKARRLRGSDDQ